MTFETDQLNSFLVCCYTDDKKKKIMQFGKMWAIFM